MIRPNKTCFLAFFAFFCIAASAQQKPPASSSAKPAAVSSGSDLVVLRIEGEPITEKQVMAALIPMARQIIPAGSTEQQRNVNLVNGVIANITVETLLKNEARRQKLAPDKATVELEVQNYAKKFSTPEEYQKALAKQGFTEASLRNYIEMNMSVQLLLDKAVKDLPAVADAEVQKFYDENPKSFQAPERVHAAHILLLVNKDATPEQKAELKKKIEGIRADIESKKISFSEAAAKYSQDTGNAAKGGDLGFFARGVMVKPFEDAVFSMEPGSLSQVVETEFGYHIIHLLEKKPAGKTPFEEVKADIKRRLDQANRTKAVQRYANDLKAKATIETYMTAEEFINRHPAGR